MWDDAIFDSASHRMLMADVGLMSLYIADCQSLSEIAAILGNAGDAKELTERAEKYSKKLETLWDDQFGLYLNKDLVTGKPSHRLTPTLFYPLLTKVPSMDQASRMMKEHFYNPNEFWGEYILPSVARNDKVFNDNQYLSLKSLKNYSREIDQAFHFIPSFCISCIGTCTSRKYWPGCNGKNQK
jgi:hypothetical protein